MGEKMKAPFLVILVAICIIFTGFTQSWNSALTILNMGVISAILAIGLNMQWGYGGLFNVGVMGFVALGGLAAVLISQPPVMEAWAAGGARLIFSLGFALSVILGVALFWRKLLRNRFSYLLMGIGLLIAFSLYRQMIGPAIARIEAVNPAVTGYLGGAGLPVLLAWPVGGLLAAGVAWLIGKTALGLRSDYLAIATLGISEIIIAVMKNEAWLARGVKNVIGLERPVPYEIDLQNDPVFVAQAAGLGMDPVSASTLAVKASYLGLFSLVLIVVYILAQLALKSPWGRMIRAIRDNEVSARAMGKDVKARHLQIFILGSAICGIAGAMMTTLDGQLTPGSYHPLRFTFLIWVMVIVGGAGNNLGAVIGGILIWFIWVQVEPAGQALAIWGASLLPEGSALGERMIGASAQLRFVVMGGVLLLMLRFAPRGLLPEK